MAHTPTPENAGIVMALAAAGQTEVEIATYLRVDAKTLRKYYAAEIRNGRSIVTSQVAGQLMKAAMAGQPETTNGTNDKRKGRPKPSTRSTVFSSRSPSCSHLSVRS